jgi:D-threo-aldose 1-dehydrogenase
MSGEPVTNSSIAANPVAQGGLIAKRPIGRTGVQVTLMGVGCGSLATGGNQQETAAMLDAAWEAGLRYFDTAPLYRDSERMLGEALAGRRREDFVLSTKVGRFPGPAGERRFDFSREAIEGSLEHSLKRLGVGYVDLVALHDPTPAMLGDRYEDEKRLILEASHDYLTCLKAQGVVGAIGVALHDPDAAVQWLDAAPFDYVMIAGSCTLISHAALTELLPLCASRGIGVLAAAPLNSGLLATGALAGARFNYQEASAPLLDKVARIESICGRFGVSLRAAALQFPLFHPAVASVVAGSRTPSEIGGNASAIIAPIPPELWRALVDESLLLDNPCFQVSEESLA